MQNNAAEISLSEFLELSDVSSFTPETVIYAAGGTRRSAVLAGVNGNGSEYALWSFLELLAAMAVIFADGTRHIITHAVIPPQFQESTPKYREHLYQWIKDIFGGKQAITEYQKRGWNVGLLLFGDEELRANLADADRVLRFATYDDQNTKNLWLTFTASYDDLWTSLLEMILARKPVDRLDAIRNLCGAEIPPATLFLGYGKISISPATIHPLLMGDNMASYWKQRPGYSLTPKEWRRLLYDYAVTRKTWMQDKTGRAEKVIKYAEEFEDAHIVGIGKRIGPFWFPINGDYAEED